jgi:hypothetical protein
VPVFTTKVLSPVIFRFSNFAPAAASWAAAGKGAVVAPAAAPSAVDMNPRRFIGVALLVGAQYTTHLDFSKILESSRSREVL